MQAAVDERFKVNSAIQQQVSVSREGNSGARNHSIMAFLYFSRSVLTLVELFNGISRKSLGVQHMS